MKRKYTEALKVAEELFGKLAPGEDFEYHFGFLAVDRTLDIFAMSCGNAAMAASDFGYGVIFAKKEDDGYHYIFRRGTLPWGSE